MNVLGSIGPRPLHDGIYLNEQTYDDHDGRHRDPASAVDFVIGEDIWICTFATGHQENACEDHYGTNSHPHEIFLSEELIVVFIHRLDCDAK
jgi:hypothetical protein